MFGARLGIVVSISVVMGWSGCLDATTSLVDNEAVPHDRVMGTVWELALDDCEEGGFVASSFQVRGGPWKQRNIRPEVGPEALAAIPRTGNWHNGIHCQGGNFEGEAFGDFQFGWVGVGIEPPPFDPGGADQHFILAGLGLPESTARDALLATINADISRATGAQVTWTAVGPGTVVETIYADKDKGVYGGKGPITPYREIGERIVRFWWTVPANGERIIHDHHGSADEPQEMPEGGFVPAYWDLTYPSATQWSSPGDRSSHTTHTGTTDHGTPMQVGPVTVPTQGETGEANSNVVYHYPSATLRFGGLIEGANIDYEWVH